MRKTDEVGNEDYRKCTRRSTFTAPFAVASLAAFLCREVHSPAEGGVVLESALCLSLTREADAQELPKEHYARSNIRTP
ncbi:hypothetical protein NDU88_003933 [Pleurodeles waltl]|uniref:Uncharacterized protein n=1 Tax=Pleurodeles waltl TaxID=8319 RepID=A0AAV7PCK4_PLEWA|nr:hypothetical protein NDU88_003933 [Pleurodeles waltl]